MNDILQSLNEKQREAATKTEGPILILAGAGSGKTKTLTHRVAYLIREKRVFPGNILAVTFTNKAAGEMKERIAKLLGKSTTNYSLPTTHSSLPLIGTFHSVCVRILRKDIDKIGRESNFHIYDSAEQKTVMKEVIKELKLDPKQYKPGSFLAAVSNAKNELMNEKAFEMAAQGYFEEMVAKAYWRYQEKLVENNALDFDDILRFTVELFEKIPAIKENYQDIFRYVLVDEYQDTNKAQYRLVRQLTEKHRNLCVVGDDAQSVYLFRGADIRNILEFEKDFPDAYVVCLEQNYRSTRNILDAADAVISNNVNRKEKRLWTTQSGGEKLHVFEARDETNEAQFVAREIGRLHEEKNVPYSSFAVLYRTNAQSRALEEQFLSESIPYRIIGGIRFYERKEIKDVVAYLRFIVNSRDTLALKRIVNEPKRGIGKQTLFKWLEYAKEVGKSPVEVGINDSLKKSGLNDGKIKAVQDFCGVVADLQKKQQTQKLSQFLESVFRKTGYEKTLTSENTAESKARMENIAELLSVAKRYDESENQEALKRFLEAVALASDTDEIDQQEKAVYLMTIHSAKGLEFSHVFLVGLEEGIFPHSRSAFSQRELEEERRLMYVGITRAKIQAYLTHAETRLLYGSTQANPPSRFLGEIPENLKENKHFLLDSIQDDDNFSPTNMARSHKGIKRYDLSPKKRSKVESRKSESSFSDGEKVSHATFGRGIVVSQSDDMYTIVFQGAGVKKIAKGLGVLQKSQ